MDLTFSWSVQATSKIEENNNYDGVKDKNDPANVNAYSQDIYHHLRSRESMHRPDSDYMTRQLYVDDAQRTGLVEWLAELAAHENFPNSTLYLSVAYVDRILSQWSVKSDELHLLGLVAMMIAAKVDHEHQANASRFLFYVGHRFSKSHALRVERLLLRALNFDLLVPTAHDFLIYYCEDLGDRARFLAMYLCELTLMETQPYTQVPPSFLAASVVAVAQHTLAQPVWPRELEVKSGYSFLDLQHCFFFVEKTFQNPPDSMHFQGVQKKYQAEEYLAVSLVKPRRHYSYVRCW